mgnify:CR=1 FL=1
MRKNRQLIMKKSLMKKIEVVDRIGSGDAYISGFLYGLLKENGTARLRWNMEMQPVL